MTIIDMFMAAYLVLFLIAFVEDFLLKNVNLYTQFAIAIVTVIYAGMQVFFFNNPFVDFCMITIIILILILDWLDRTKRFDSDKYFGSADVKILLFTIPVFAIYGWQMHFVYIINTIILLAIVSGAQQIWCWIRKDKTLTTPAIFAVMLAFCYTIAYQKLIIGG